MWRTLLCIIRSKCRYNVLFIPDSGKLDDDDDDDDGVEVTTRTQHHYSSSTLLMMNNDAVYESLPKVCYCS